MKWANLRLNKCPSCSSDLDWDTQTALYQCSKCEFIITEEKLKSLIKKMNSKKPSFGHMTHYRPDDEVPEAYEEY